MLDRSIVDLWQLRARHQLLEDDLVHAHGRREHTGADVGDVETLEQSLDRAVLTERAVQDREHDVGAEQPAAGKELHLLAVESPPAIAADLDADHLVAGLRQAGADRGARRQ